MLWRMGVHIILFRVRDCRTAHMLILCLYTSLSASTMAFKVMVQQGTVNQSSSLLSTACKLRKMLSGYLVIV